MSIINDALKKAGTKRQHYQLAEPSSRKRWPFWIVAGAAGLLGVTLAVNLFDNPTSNFVALDEATSEVPPSAFQLKEVLQA